MSIGDELDGPSSSFRGMVISLGERGHLLSRDPPLESCGSGREMRPTICRWPSVIRKLSKIYLNNKVQKDLPCSY